eukprot:11214720-Lingulodinium_polyedra.AAC.1
MHSHGHRMGEKRPYNGKSTARAWQSMAIAWQTHGKIIAKTWQAHANIMAKHGNIKARAWQDH